MADALVGEPGLGPSLRLRLLRPVSGPRTRAPDPCRLRSVRPRAGTSVPHGGTPGVLRGVEALHAGVQSVVGRRWGRSGIRQRNRWLPRHYRPRRLGQRAPPGRGRHQDRREAHRRQGPALCLLSRAIPHDLAGDPAYGDLHPHGRHLQGTHLRGHRRLLDLAYHSRGGSTWHRRRHKTSRRT